MHLNGSVHLNKEVGKKFVLVPSKVGIRKYFSAFLRVSKSQKKDGYSQRKKMELWLTRTVLSILAPGQCHYQGLGLLFQALMIKVSIQSCE